MLFHIVYLAQSFDLHHFQSRWPLVLPPEDKKESFDRSSEICCLFLFSGLPMVVWTYKRQRKKEVTNLNHSKFARMFIFLSLNGGKLNKKNEINNVQTHRERETKSQCVAVPLISSNVTQIVKSFQAIKVEQKYSREKQKRKNE